MSVVDINLKHSVAQLRLKYSPISSSALSNPFFPLRKSNHSSHRLLQRAVEMKSISLCSKLFIFFGIISILYFSYVKFSAAPFLLETAGSARSKNKGLFGLTGSKQHPIELLVEKAKAKYANMLKRQSKTLEEAVTEYRRRYSREPPPGFENWYKAAVDANVPIIDEYDTVMAAFEPFWGVSGKEIRARVQEAVNPRVGKTPIIGVHLKDQKVSLAYNGNMYAPWHSRILKDWIEHYVDYLPDLDIAFNSHDEPEVVIPRDELERSVEGCPHPEKYDAGKPNEQAETHDPQLVYFDSLRRQRTWNRVIESCPLDSASRSRKASEPDNSADYSDGPLFIQNITRAKDICEETDAASMHGMFTSPDGFVLTNSLVPVFSRSKASSFQDLLLPAVDYDTQLTEGVYKEYNLDEDMPWEKKKSHLYWAGTSLDGYYQDSNWKTMQRVRFVKDMNNASLPVSLMRRDDKAGRWEAHNETMSSLSEYVDVKFTAQEMCDEVICKEMKEPENGLVWKEKEPPTEAYANQFVMDVDGHAFTERFRRFLSSRSLVFKMTMFQVVLGPYPLVFPSLADRLPV